MVRSGSISSQDGRLVVPGVGVYLWSSWATLYGSEPSTASFLEIVGNNVSDSSRMSNRWRGYSLRCLAD